MAEMTRVKAEILSKSSLFARLPQNEIENLAASLETCAYQPGEVLFTEGSLTEYFYLIMEGEVEIVKSLETADERVLAISGRGAVLGEMSMFSHDGTHTASARAHAPMSLLKITFAQFDAILHRHPELAYDLLRIYSRRLEQGENLTIQDLRHKNEELTQAYQDLKAAQAAMIEKEKLEHELEIAAEIQRDILPDLLPEQPGWDFGALMIPARQVGGDFYDLIPLDGDHIGIVVGDVCDKGMPAALFMALTYSAVRTEAFRHSGPGDMLRTVNQHLLQVNRSTMYVTLLYGILDCTSGVFEYARAGHPEPLMLDGGDQPVPVLMGLGQPIGLFDRPAIDEQRLVIPSGGTLLIYSDGLSETVDTLPGAPELADLCAQVMREHHLPPQGLCDHLWAKLGGSTAESLIQDDFTVVGLRKR